MKSEVYQPRPRTNLATASLVIGFIGGIVGMFAGISVFATTLTPGLMPAVRGLLVVFAGLTGALGSMFSLFRPFFAAIAMIISAILGLIILPNPFALAALLLIIAGVLDLIESWITGKLAVRNIYR